jgi:hypothetical protein
MIIRRWYRTVERMVSWGWAMRDNHDWDSQYLLEVILYKLERIYKESISNTNFVWTQDPSDKDEYRPMVALRICIMILKRLTKRDSIFYAEGAYAKFEEKWGDLVPSGTGLLNFKRANSSPDRAAEEDADYKYVSDLSYGIYSRDYNLLWTLLNKYSPHWWT